MHTKLDTYTNMHTELDTYKSKRGKEEYLRCKEMPKQMQLDPKANEFTPETTKK